MKPRRIFYGWWIVAAGLGVNSLSSTLYVYGFGAFFIPWQEAFGWSRAALGGLIGMARLEGGLMAPIAGWLIDKYGPRRMMFLGISLMGVGFLALSQIRSLTMLYVVFIGLLATGSSLGTGRAVQVAVVNWFVRRRGRAIGLLMTGFGVGGSFVFLLGMAIEKLGWQGGAILAGIITLVVGYPLAWIVRHKPEQMGLLPDGDKAPVLTPDDPSLERETPASYTVGSGSPTATLSQAAKPPRFWQRDPRPEIDFTVRQAVRTPAFWMLAVMQAIWAAAPAINTVHLAPFLSQELGVTYAVALAALSFFAFMTTPGRLGFGFIADYVNIRLLMAALLIIEGIGILLFSTVRTMGQVPFYIIIFAVAHGGVVSLQAVLLGYFFGRKSFGTISGVISMFSLPMAVGAPIWIGWMADTQQGGYRIAFRVMAVLLAVAATSVLLARRPRLRMPEGQLVS
ncbi:MAG: MFS transporter [Dehalococcoidia bacterium]|nr:MFS transporter [Dehalococcoidia bacterium]